MKLEVISTQLTDARIAEEAGADRLELIASILEGGLTPNYETIEEIVHSVKIPVNVMVRPHSSSFRYTANERITMLKDIDFIRKSGANGIVIGALKDNGSIDEYALESFLDKADTLEVTFHRAFDELEDQFAGLECLLKYPQIHRVLTSGGKPDVNLAVDRISKLVEMTDGSHVSILAGSGLKIETLSDFVKKTGVKEVHFGTDVRVDSQPLQQVDALRVARTKQILRNIQEQRED
jgi:copper homeostasis protein